MCAAFRSIWTSGGVLMPSHATLRGLAFLVVMCLVAACGRSAAQHAQSARCPGGKGASQAVATGVPVLPLGCVSAAPALTNFSGNCAGLGLPAADKGSFSTSVSSGGGYTQTTTFWVAAAPQDFIYCAQIQTPVIAATATGPGASTWTGDDMEFWLAPTNDRATVRTPDTYQLLFNPLGGWNNTQGTGNSASPFSFTWKSGVRFKALEQPAKSKTPGWAVLAELPWSSVGLTTSPKAGDVLGFNTGGCIGTGCTTTDWIATLNESNWHTPSLWGELKVQ